MIVVGNDRQAALAEIEQLLERLEGERTFTLDAVEDALIDRIKALRIEAGRIRRDLEVLSEGNEDGSNRDVPPFDNDPRTDDQIKQSVYDAYDRGEWD